MKIDSLRIGTRQSPLAMWQANWVGDQLRAAHPELQIEIIKIKTQGDKNLETPLAKIGDKGLFTQEIERTLLENQIDLAVHSLKDLPTVLPAGLKLGAVCKRENPADVLVSLTAKSIEILPQHATIATSSLRRKAQLLHLRPDLNIVDVRGNIGTRLTKLKTEKWDGMVLAYAGLKRLNLEKKIACVLSFEEMLPAVSQGALGIEIRSNDEKVETIIKKVNDPEAQVATEAERALLKHLEGGCQVPVAALAHIENELLVLRSLVISLDGKNKVYKCLTGDKLKSAELGIELAEQLLSAGADKILAEIRNA